MRTDGRLARGDRTRAAVLDTAVTLATENGLDGLSLGQLAEQLGVSKSGLFAHWRTKMDLQLATIERAKESFKERVVAVAMAEPAGVRRLWTMHEARLTYIGDKTLPGGCFFVNAQVEFDARTGPVRDQLAVVLREWLDLLKRLAVEAVAEGHLRADVDTGLLAYEVNAAGAATVYQSRLLPDSSAMALARAAVLGRLRALCTDPGLLPAE
ncbi:TetR/AcrR family transcriptional regulator [Actinophytocola oryzae]|uniref:TetR family transcriptional regulator n=1 Tax=Actinophytocola oryzae TaxID=502181 RepID=A0A4R7W4X9_9PSEU|nr:helix-turn-helix domain-containing protein [Actinophytocola oryzae]TDV57602.1 TetR family transcriptional regulator [Actinophytocola oryzae]